MVSSTGHVPPRARPTARRVPAIELLVPAIAVVHLVIGLFFAGRLSLWGDEAFSSAAADLDTRSLLSMVTDIDVNMSAYYLVLHAWATLFGTGEVALRLLSLLMTSATVVIGGRLVSRWFGPVAGVAAAIALGMSPYLLTIGLTVRPFAMLGLVTVISMACLVRALDRSDVAPWIVLALVDVLAIYTSLLACLVIGAQIAYLVLVDRRFRPGMVPAAGILAVGVVPTLLFLAPADTLDWLTGTRIVDVVLDVAGYKSGIVLVALFVAGLVLWPRPVDGALARVPRGRALLPFFALVPFAGMIVLLPVQTLFTPSYLVAVFVASAMLAGAAVSRLSGPLATAAVGLLALTLLVGVVTRFEPQPGFEDQDWRGATEILDARVVEGEAVAFPNTFYRVAGEHYAGAGHYTDVAEPVLPTTPWFEATPYEYDHLKRTEHYLGDDVVLDEVTGHDRVWLVGPDDHFMSFDTTEMTDAGWVVTDEFDVAGIVGRLLVRSP